MKKRFYFILFFMILIFSVYAQNKTVNWNSTIYPVETRPSEFLLAFKNSKPMALMFKINDYHKIMQTLRGDGERLGIDITKAFNPSIVVKANTMVPYSVQDILAIAMRGALVTPNEDVYLFNNATSSSVSGNAANDHSEQTVKYNDITYKLAYSVAGFIDDFINSKASALAFKVNDYPAIIKQIESAAAGKNLNVKDIYDSSLVINLADNTVYPSRQLFAIERGTKANPNADVYIFNKIIPPPPARNVPESTINNLFAYYKHLASLWWARQNRNAVLSPELRAGSKICDSCNAEVKYGDGYCYGYFSGEQFTVYRLWCNRCMEYNVTRYKEGYDYFDEMDVFRANNFAESKNRR